VALRRDGRAPHDGSVASWSRAAPRFLDPVLGVVEELDRIIRRMRPVRPGGLLAIERHRHRGTPVTLRDGTVVRAGDPAWVIHFSNRRLRQLASAGWQTAGFRVAREDLRTLAAWHAAEPPDRRPIAYTGTTLLASLTRRMGFEVHERPATPWARLEDWYLRSILVRWAPAGRRRLGSGHQPMRARRTWISGDELVRIHGSNPPRTQ
jgi:YkoP domain